MKGIPPSLSACPLKLLYSLVVCVSCFSSKLHNGVCDRKEGIPKRLVCTIEEMYAVVCQSGMYSAMQDRMRWLHLRSASPPRCHACLLVTRGSSARTGPRTRQARRRIIQTISVTRQYPERSLHAFTTMSRSYDRGECDDARPLLLPTAAAAADAALGARRHLLK